MNEKQIDISVIQFLILLIASVVSLTFLPPVILTLILLLFLISALHQKAKPGSIRILLWVAVVISAYFASQYKPDGYQSPIVYSEFRFYPGGEAFTLSVNVAKWVGGCILLYFFGATFLRRDHFSFKNIFLVFLTVVAVVLTAYVFTPLIILIKFNEEIFLFLIVNLFVTCFAEELFYRGLMQEQLNRFLPVNRWSLVLVLVSSTLVFSATHYSGENKLFLLYLLVGFYYACCYQLTRSISLTILAHFLVNAIHIVLFNYPL